MTRHNFSLGIFLLLVFAACGPKVETVEMKNDFGQTERYQRRKKDFAKEGLYQRFHQEGYLIEEAQFVNDTMHGVRKMFYQNGKLERTEDYKHGILHGLLVLYYENGQKQLEQAYVQGVLQGLSTKWYKSGVLSEKVNMRNNEENGPFTEWHENGNLKAEGFYLDGDNEHDTLKLYDTLGQLERRMVCHKGACSTIWLRE
ncbi:MAG: toxin-antitoxin system YwqK family antitoxin [Saprospiraceae bacterium]